MFKPKESTMERKYVKHISNTELVGRMAEEFVSMHQGGYIDLLHWETALEVVERYYNVDAKIVFTKKEDA
jgi:hypothetical protein